MEELINLDLYFFSLRTINDNGISQISLDIKIPITWTYDFETKNKIVVQDKNNSMVLISIIDEFNKLGIENSISIAKKIIEYNKNEEEKKILFNLKMEELKKIFLEQPLEKLKELNF